MDAVRAGAAAVQPARRARRVCIAAPARRIAPESAGHGGGHARLFVQHRRELHDQHELAGLRRREHDELSHPDARADGAELPVRSDRDGGGDRADPRLRPPEGRDHRQLLGRHDAKHALHPAAARLHPGAGARVARRRADLLRLSECPAPRGGRVRQPEARCGRTANEGREGQPRHREGDSEGAGHRSWAGGVPGRHQAARDQRWRLLQRQLGTPVGESDPARELSRDALDPADRRRRFATPSDAWSATRARAGRCSRP